MSHQSLAKPPIREAVLDLQVILEPGTGVSVLQPIVSELEKNFPLVDPLFSYQGGVEFGEGRAQTRAASTPLGFLLKSQDKRIVLQFRTDGFTYSRLDGYPGWDEMYEGAMQAWSHFVKSSPLVCVRRVAARYINAIRFEIPSVLADYFVHPPAVPHNLRIQDFLTRCVVGREQSQNRAVLTLASERAVEPGMASIILDIDAYRIGEWKPVDTGIGEILTELREFKNELFFGSLTEKAIEMYR